MTDESEMLKIVAVLSETYTDQGVAVWLGSPHKVLSPRAPVIHLCLTADGRRQVLEFAESMTGMVAS